MALRAFSSYGFEVNGKLTLRVAITGVKCFAITGAALNQMARPALGHVIAVSSGLSISSVCSHSGVVTATNKHTKASLA